MKRSVWDIMNDDVELQDALEAGHVQQYVSVKQAASLLSVSKRTIYRLIADGSLPTYFIRSCVRLKWTDLQAYVEED
ncbi:MAG: helix-turn-helix domain-containing protein [Chloroflexi bacterium]|nr:helix-turn-helix domain-containing protein [Chloroflexota bacterium]